MKDFVTGLMLLWAWSVRVKKIVNPSRFCVYRRVGHRRGGIILDYESVWFRSSLYFTKKVDVEGLSRMSARRGGKKGAITATNSKLPSFQGNPHINHNF